MTLWERRISHIDRRVGPLHERPVRKQLRKAAARKRRGLPSRNMSLDLAFRILDLHWVRLRGETPPGAEVARLEWQLLRERVIERKRTQRDAARCRSRVCGNRIKINLWRRRSEWLAEVEESRRQCSALDPDDWLAENAIALRSSDDYVEQHGLPLWPTGARCG